MTDAQNISLVLLNGRSYSTDLTTRIVSTRSYGGSMVAAQNDLIFLNALIDSLQRYYDTVFDNNGSTVVVDYDVLTPSEAQNIVVQINQMIGNNKYQYSNWILADGFWNDDGVWDDDDVWNDSQPLN